MAGQEEGDCVRSIIDRGQQRFVDRDEDDRAVRQTTRAIFESRRLARVHDDVLRGMMRSLVIEIQNKANVEQCSAVHAHVEDDRITCYIIDDRPDGKRMPLRFEIERPVDFNALTQAGTVIRFVKDKARKLENNVRTYCPGSVAVRQV